MNKDTKAGITMAGEEFASYLLNMPFLTTMVKTYLHRHGIDSNNVENFDMMLRSTVQSLAKQLKSR